MRNLGKLLCFIVVSSCTEISEDASVVEPVHVGPKLKEVIAFLDLSNSMDSTSDADLVVKGLRTITDSLDGPYRLRLFPVCKDANFGLLDSCTVRVFSATSERNTRIAAAATRRALARRDTLLARIPRLYAGTNRAGKGYNSCVSDNLNALCQYLKEDPEPKERYVLFFTDLFEECTLRGAGKITLNMNSTPAQVKTMMAAVEKGYSPECRIGDIAGLRLALVVSTNDVPSGGRALDRTELERFWYPLLWKHGIKDTLHTIYFDPEAVGAMFN